VRRVRGRSSPLTEWDEPSHEDWGEIKYLLKSSMRDDEWSFSAFMGLRLKTSRDNYDLFVIWYPVSSSKWKVIGIAVLLIQKIPLGKVAYVEHIHIAADFQRTEASEVLKQKMLEYATDQGVSRISVRTDDSTWMLLPRRVTTKEER
jgi:hypothetical protein